MHGLIEGRSGATIILQASDAGRVIVLLTDSTQVGQVQGVLKARRKDMSMAALVPGLAIDIEGEYNGQRQLVAKTRQVQGRRSQAGAGRPGRDARDEGADAAAPDGTRKAERSLAGPE